MHPNATRTSRLLCLLFFSVALRPSACQAQVSVAFPPSHKLVMVSVPDKPAALQMDIRQLGLDANTIRSDGSGAQLLAHDASWTLSISGDPAGKKVDAQGLRAHEQPALLSPAMKAGQVKTSERPSMALLEYMIETSQGRNVHQKNVVAYLVSGQQWFTVHISKVAYFPDDDRFFSAFLDSIKIIEIFQPDSRTRFGYGSVFFFQKNWPRAIPQYEKALELERVRKALPQAQWRVMVDNLGTAYGMSGDLPKAKQMFEFGITQDPEYTMFHYHLACTEAEGGNLDDALEDLRAAFRYRRNSITSAGVPDPVKDSSFEHYRNDPRFTGAARQLCPSSHQTAAEFICD